MFNILTYIYLKLLFMGILFFFSTVFFSTFFFFYFFFYFVLENTQKHNIGAGKGTQCKMIAKEFGFTHLSTGACFLKK